jgi:phosphoribosylanthranilate isomerase
MRTRVKVCGITRIGDALAAAAAGVDAIGLVFAEVSPRHVSIEQARALCAALPPFVTSVGLFVDATPAQLREVLGQVPLDLLQFHGQETPEQCRGYGRPYIKAIPMRPGVDLAAQARRYADAAGLLLDAYSPGLAGGSGQVFDWGQVPRDVGLPIVLAGGLTPQNVAAAIRQVRPYAVDVSSGVEQDKGIKDPAKIVAFMRSVNE